MGVRGEGRIFVVSVELEIGGIRLVDLMVGTSLLLLTSSIYTSWFRIVALCRDIRTELTSLMTGLKQSLWSLRGCETVSSKLHCPGTYLIKEHTHEYLITMMLGYGVVVVVVGCCWLLIVDSSSSSSDGGGSLTRFNPISYHEFPWFLRWLVGHYARATG
ncbi:hypothetical protein HZH66_006116 [Vespula vulgaris]|uniref:Uncharacterized protein n=1 Tax=Vespula vulgaris TaxID=7454 RepID=A0A834K7R2_VESVU|nr:hypothetical protein HZH66_006116 [Vespula vulgaris]